VTTTKRRAERQRLNPDLALMASRLDNEIRSELFERLAADGYAGLHSRHWTVLAYLDEDGVRATELARLSGRHKQVVGRLVDELEDLGYVERQPDPADRRAKLVVPTERGLEQLRRGDAIVAEIEARHADAMGRRSYANFRDSLRNLIDRGETTPAP
jgi:DNA-binding MarR family transcriptional regulator